MHADTCISAVRLTSTIENVGLVDKLQHTIIAVKQFVNGCKIAFAFRSKMLYLCSTKVGSWPNQANSPFILPQIRVKKVKTLWKFRDGALKKA
jgi:hypothetical protein